MMLPGALRHSITAWVCRRRVWGWVPCAPRTVVGVAYVRPVYAPRSSPGWRAALSVGIGWRRRWSRRALVPTWPRVKSTCLLTASAAPTLKRQCLQHDGDTTVVNNYYNNCRRQQAGHQHQIREPDRAQRGNPPTSRETFTSARPVGRDMMKKLIAGKLSRAGHPTRQRFAPQQRSVVGAGAPVCGETIQRDSGTPRGGQDGPATSARLPIR